MPTVKLDSMRDLDYDEDGGKPVSLTRSVKIYGGTGTDIRALKTALDSVSLGVGDAADSTDDLWQYLVLKGRNISLDPNSAGEGGSLAFDAVLTYEFMDVIPSFRGSGSLEQVETNFDNDDNQITVEHEFSDDDPEFPGQTIVQGVDATKDEITKQLNMRIVVETDDPDALLDEWLNVVNSETWKEKEARTWKVTGGDYEEFLANVEPFRWVFNFIITYKKDGWDKTYVFRNPKTGKVPSDLVEADGTVTPEFEEGKNLTELWDIGQEIL